MSVIQFLIIKESIYMADNIIAENVVVMQTSDDVCITVTDEFLDGGYASASSAKVVQYAVPQAEYMYGCTATAVGMIIGYYDRWGYLGYDVSNLIDGTVELNARGTDKDGNAYDMDAFDTVLGSAIASKEYVERFWDKSAEHELSYTFVNGDKNNPVLNTAAWNCLADYLGTGQYWRGNDDLATSFYYTSLSSSLSSNGQTKVNGVSMPYRYVDFIYGLSLYVEDAGYRLDAGKSKTVRTDNNGGTFTFEDYCAEIDAGRLVVVHIDGHSMTGYGYDKATKEIIFDDTYKHDQRMKWDGTYDYGGECRLRSISTIVFDIASVMPIPEKPAAPEITLSTEKWTSSDVVLTVSFDEKSVLNEYSFDGRTWQKYTAPVTVDYNRYVYFRSCDQYGKYSDTASRRVSNIDKEKPYADISGNVSEITNKDIVLKINASDDLSGISSIEYSYDNINWESCGEELVIDRNGTVYFRITDKAGNSVSYIEVIDKIDKTPPEKVQVSADISIPTKNNVKVTAEFSSDSVKKQYSYDKINWFDYTKSLEFEENGTVYFQAVDKAGNLSAITEFKVDNIDKTPPVLTLSADTETLLEETVLTASTDDGSWIYYSTDGKTWFAFFDELLIKENGTYYLKATDSVGNIAYESVTYTNLLNSAPGALQGTPNSMSWESMASNFHFELGKDDADTALLLHVSSRQIDFFGMPYGNYDCRVKSASGITWSETIDISSNNSHITPQYFKSDADGADDVFFADSYSNWKRGYGVVHAGSKDRWDGTGEVVELRNKLQIKDIYEGSTDYGTLVLTDYLCGDAVSADDIFSASPVEVQAVRLSQINEIFAGAGDDIIDMTSQRFEVSGSMKIHGGSGDDVIWANNGENKLFGDAGNDRIVGGIDNDIIVGGAGNDSLHGGGGNDIFVFGSDFGNDTVEQLAGGKVTLIFESENVKWDEAAATYTDGKNSVKLSGDFEVEVRYGATPEFAAIGAFDNFTTEKIFEDKALIA